MSADKSKTSRRAFVVSGAATLGAGVAAAIAAHERPESRATAEEREAIRQLHVQFVADVEAGTRPGVVATHQAYRANGLQTRDQVMVRANGRNATATWHVDVKTGMAIEGDSTIAQMARLQGMLANVHWETGRLEARYEKTGGEWRMTGIEYLVG